MTGNNEEYIEEKENLIDNEVERDSSKNIRTIIIVVAEIIVLLITIIYIECC